MILQLYSFLFSFSLIHIFALEKCASLSNISSPKFSHAILSKYSSEDVTKIYTEKIG